MFNVISEDVFKGIFGLTTIILEVINLSKRN